jgi:hypothetical protein
MTTTKDKIKPKFSHKRTVCALVGYDVHHADDIYRLLKTKTRSIIKSSYAVCFGEMCVATTKFKMQAKSRNKEP